MNWKHDLRALGDEGLPREVDVAGRTYGLEQEYKHSVMAAVGLYARDGERVVCKFYRRRRFFGLPAAWLGSMLAEHEKQMLRRLRDLAGVPGLWPVDKPGLVVRAHVPGRPMVSREALPDDFFPRLQHLIRQMHGRGVTYVDLEKPDNVLIGTDGRPWLIDFTIAFATPRRQVWHIWPLPVLWRWFQRGDLYHVRKHFRRSRPDLLDEEQISRWKRKPWPVRAGTMLTHPVKSLGSLLRWCRRRHGSVPEARPRED